MFSFFKKTNTISALFLIVLSFAFFYKFFIHHLVSIPTDITVGMYYPWLDQRWSGLTTNVPVKNPLMSDIVSIIYQWRILSIDSLKNGFFPFWTKYYLSGVPLFANFQNSILNFTNIFFFIITDNSIAWTLMVLSQLIFLLLSTYFCLRTLKFQKISSIIGAITSSFSLFTIVWLEYGIHTYVAAFLPLFIICIEKYWQKEQPKFLIYLSFLIALQFYGGYPQFSIFSLIFIFFYFIFISPKRSLKNIFNFSLYLILGLTLTLPLLMPGYQLISKSIRQFDTTALQDSTKGFLPIKNLSTLPIPNFWGNPATSDYFGQGYYDNNAIFPGTLALTAFLVFIYLFIKKNTDKKTNFFTLTILLSIIISVQNPLSSFLKNNFGFIFSGNGISTRIFILANFSFAVLSAKFIDLILKNKFKNILVLSLVPVWQIIILMLCFFKKNTNNISVKNSFYSLALSLIILFSLILIVLIRKYSKYIIYLLLFSTIFELFYYALKYLPFSKSEYLFPLTPSIEFLQKNTGNYRISTTNTIPANMWAPYGLSSPDGYDTTMPLLNYEYYSLTQTQDFSQNVKRAIAYINVESNLYQNLSVKYKLTLGTNTKASEANLIQGFTPVFNETSTVIEENKNVLPKIHFIDQILFATDKNDFKNIYPDTNFATSAILYSSDKPDFSTFNSDCQSTESNINLTEDKDNYISFNTQNNCSKLAFVSNSFYPGWQAYIDGQPTKIYQTNHAFQSVLIPAGEHKITLKYVPQHFRLYLILASLSAVTLLGILINPSKFSVKSK